MPGPVSIFHLGDELVSRGLVTGAQLEEAVAHQAGSKRALQDVLIDLEMVSEEDVFRVLAEKTELPTVDPNTTPIEPEAMKLVPYSLTQRYNAVPLTVRNRVLAVAMSNPLDLLALDDLAKVTGRTIEPILATRSQIAEAIQRNFGMEDAVYDLLKKIEPAEEIEVVSSLVPEPEEDEEAPDAPIVALGNLIVSDAVRIRASDIHIEPAEHEVFLRYRVDGVLKDVMMIPTLLHRQLVSRVKIMTGTMDIAERRKPQDGRARILHGGRQVDLRVSTLPTYFGEKVVIRILDPQAVVLDLAALGFEPEQLEKFQDLIQRPQGMVLITGPTGSGKTTTLYAALQQVKSRAKNVITLEEPVEYILEGINQVEINEKVGVLFSTGLRSILRQDPDIILVGEIRDLDTAKTAVEASMTGHLLFSTLHTNSAVAAIPRLVDLGVESYLLADSLIGVVAQRLLRRVCSHCGATHSPTEKEREVLSRLAPDLLDTTFSCGQGCAHCDFTGYRGRVAVYSILIVTDAIRKAVADGSSEVDIERVAVGEGMNLLVHAGLKKAEEGTTTLEEVSRTLVTGREASFCRTCRLPSRDPATCAQCLASGGQRPSTPSRPKPPTAISETPPSPPETSPRPRVLMACGDSEVRQALAAALRHAGYDVMEAVDGKAALEDTFRAEPDLVVLDIRLPQMSGYDVCRRLRDRLSTGRLPVILLTEQDDTESELQGIDAGADDFMRKPVSPKRLVAHCTMLLRRDQTGTHALRRKRRKKSTRTEHIPDNS